MSYLLKNKANKLLMYVCIEANQIRWEVGIMNQVSKQIEPTMHMGALITIIAYVTLI